jgi:hypothetical protein
MRSSKSFLSRIGHRLIAVFQAFCYNKGKFRPPFFWISLILFPVVLAVFAKIIMAIVVFVETRHIELTDTMIATLLGFVAAWITIYTWYDKNKPAPADPQDLR